MQLSVRLSAAGQLCEQWSLACSGVWLITEIWLLSCGDLHFRTPEADENFKNRLRRDKFTGGELFFFLIKGLVCFYQNSWLVILSSPYITI